MVAAKVDRIQSFSRVGSLGRTKRASRVKAAALANSSASTRRAISGVAVSSAQRSRDAPRQNQPPAATATTNAAPMPTVLARGSVPPVGPDGGCTTGSDEGAARAASSAKATSRADWNRSAGAFSRHRLTTRSSAGDTAASSDSGSSRRMAVMVSAQVSRRNARRPESISKITAPRAKTSDRASAFSPCTCSGDMYPTVPSGLPGLVAGENDGVFSSAPEIA